MKTDSNIWRTKDGREIPVTDMEDLHLLRTIRMLECRIVTLGLQDLDNKFFQKLRDSQVEEATDSLKMLKSEAERRKLGSWAKFGVELAKKVLE